MISGLEWNIKLSIISAGNSGQIESGVGIVTRGL